MRWKLLIVASLLAAIAGAGACFAAGYFLLAPGRSVVAPFWGLAALLVPLAAITYACVFVYRHTARRRTLQAAATALLALLLTLTALLVVSVLTRRPSPFLFPRPSPTSNAA